MVAGGTAGFDEGLGPSGGVSPEAARRREQKDQMKDRINRPDGSEDGMPSPEKSPQRDRTFYVGGTPGFYDREELKNRLRTEREKDERSRGR